MNYIVLDFDLMYLFDVHTSHVDFIAQLKPNLEITSCGTVTETCCCGGCPEINTYADPDDTIKFLLMTNMKAALI